VREELGEERPALRFTVEVREQVAELDRARVRGERLGQTRGGVAGATSRVVALREAEDRRATGGDVARTRPGPREPLLEPSDGRAVLAASGVDRGERVEDVDGRLERDRTPISVERAVHVAERALREPAGARPEKRRRVTVSLVLHLLRLPDELGVKLR